MTMLLLLSVWQATWKSLYVCAIMCYKGGWVCLHFNVGTCTECTVQFCWCNLQWVSLWHSCSFCSDQHFVCFVNPNRMSWSTTYANRKTSFLKGRQDSDWDSQDIFDVICNQWVIWVIKCCEEWNHKLRTCHSVILVPTSYGQIHAIAFSNNNYTKNFHVLSNSLKSSNWPLTLTF